MKVFVHAGQGAVEPREADIDHASTAAALLLQVGAEPDALLWIEEAEDPLDPGVTLVEAGVVEFSHLHHGRCRRVAATVRFGGEPKERAFSPSATVQTVFAWAESKEGFDLPAEQRPKHTLGLCGTQTEADRRAHLGSLASDCRVCFDLAPKTRYQG
jgi:hypothetical protein